MRASIKGQRRDRTADSRTSINALAEPESPLDVFPLLPVAAAAAAVCLLASARDSRIFACFVASKAAAAAAVLFWERRTVW